MSRATSVPGVLHLTPVVPPEPGADGGDWRSGRRTAAPAEDYVQGALAVDFRHDAYDSFFGPQATPTTDLPEASAWAERMLRAVLEVCAGSRPVEQLSRWLSPDVRDRIGRRGQLARRRAGRHRPPRVRTLLTCHPADGVCELSAVILLDGRVRALAVRMSGVDGRWVITAFELG
ncbi:hypothetical protein BJF86_09225 [Serinicoccus sp. CNJ-927]|uniref:Rv3235 family protein n=1 Tax=Serinicoccus TaxID=265976 RepID=UPI0003B6F43B|nr:MULTISPECIES: Rv3235 family protein [Serinicoccus]OLT15252.1 hypothetical protein BJF80_10235 [Serinicoccus sp. CUA-874]OLT39194.1 hypothetical protein BJF86_09225 [Serinicoccus sp. CNJ-927]